MALSTGQLIAEKERLQSVVEQAGTARVELTRIDKALELLGVEIPGGKFTMRGNTVTARHDCNVTDCDKSYTTGSALNKHRRDAHGIEPEPTNGTALPCPDCDYVAGGPGGLGSHRRAAHGVVGKRNGGGSV